MFNFDLLRPWHWPLLVLCFFGSWLFLGLPSLMALLGLSRFSDRVRRCSFLMPVIGLLFGLVAGVFNAWDDHYYWSTRGQTHWFDVLAVAGAPGNSMANTYGGDWQEDEAWSYHWDIAVLNGLFWLSVGVAGMLMVKILSRRSCSSNTPAPGQGAAANLRPAGSGHTL